jgi:hypothetical protein
MALLSGDDCRNIFILNYPDYMVNDSQVAAIIKKTGFIKDI